MKIRVERDMLADAVAWASKGIAPKPPIPVLAGLRLSAEAGALSDGSVHLCGFDYETSARSTAPADVMDAGSVLVSGRLLSDIVKSLPNKPVDLVTDGTKVALTCGPAKFKLLTMPEDDYPTLPAMPDSAGTVAADVFTQAVSQVSVAAAKDESLPMLTAVRIEAAGGQLTMMATDRYRLAIRTLDWTPTDPDIDTAVMVRSRALWDVAKSLTTGSTLGVGFDDGMIGFDAGSRKTTSLLIDGEYPKVRALFPAEFASTAVVDVAGMVEAVKRMSLVAERNTPVLCVFEDGTLTLEAGRGEDASGVETIDAVVGGAEQVVAAYNPTFLMDGLQALNAPYARFSFTQPGKPAVLTGQAMADSVDDDTYRYLLMPVRL